MGLKFGDQIRHQEVSNESLQNRGEHYDTLGKLWYWED